MKGLIIMAVKPNTVRMDEEVFEKFKLMQKETGLNSAQLMQKFCAMHETEELKQLNPEMTSSLEEMESMTRAIEQLFRNQLEAVKTARTLVAGEYEARRKLDAKALEKLTAENSSLKSALETSEDLVSKLMTENESLKLQVENSKKEEKTEGQLEQIMKQLALMQDNAPKEVKSKKSEKVITP